MRKRRSFLLAAVVLVAVGVLSYILLAKEKEPVYFSYRFIDHLTDANIPQSPLLLSSQRELLREVALNKKELNWAEEEWVYPSGSWKREGGVLSEVEDYSGSNRLIMALNRCDNIRNGAIRVDVKLKPGGERAAAGVCFRMVDDRNGYIVQLQSTNFVTLKKIVNGKMELTAYEDALRPMLQNNLGKLVGSLSHFKLVPYANIEVTEDKWYTLRVVFSDDELRVFVDGEHKLTVHDSSFKQAGKVGVVRVGGSGVCFKDFLVVRKSQWDKFVAMEAKEDLLSLRNSPTIDEIPKVGKPSPFVRDVKLEVEYRPVILAPPPTSISFPVEIPKGAFLEFSYAMLRDVWAEPMKQAGNGVVFEVHISEKGESPTLLFSRYINPKVYWEQRKWFDALVDLSAYGGKRANLIFQTRGSLLPELNDEKYDYAVWGNPTLYYPKKRADRVNVLLISIDTLRADHLGCYGYWRKGISPHIDSLAREGVRFEQAISHSPWTAPSHFSIFTSLTPSFHGWIYSSGTPRRLDDSIVCMTQIFEKHGYSTAAFTGGTFVSTKYGFNRGFQRYFERWETDTGFPQLMEWLDKNHQKLFFVFYHTYECHAPYQRKLFVDKNYGGGRVGKEFVYQDNLNIFPNPTPEERKFIIDSYDGGVFYVDSLIGKLVRKLKELELFDKTLIVLLSDHGEELFDHNPIALHGHSLYDELLRVPLILAGPRLLPQEKVIKEQVGLIDVMPTILEVAGLPFETEHQGVSLLPLIKGRKDFKLPPFVFSEAMTYGLEKKGLRSDSYKYIITPPNAQKWNDMYNPVLSFDKERELYDLKEDPTEKINIIEGEKELSTTFLKIIKSYLASSKGRKLYDLEKLKMKLTKEDIERLRSLGYLK